MIDHSVTLTAAGSTPAIPLDFRARQFQLSATVLVSGNCAAKAQFTLDDPFASYGAQTFVSAATWQDFPALSAVTTATTVVSDNLAFPAKAVRGLVTSYTTGTVTFQFLQALGN